MPDDLYQRDVFAWSRQQAELLRRVARGERVNNVDWDHVAEEIEGVGLSELRAVRSNLRLLIAHLLKIHGWPGNASVNHWRGEIVVFQAEAADDFAPSMRQNLDVAALYRVALRQVGRDRLDGQTSRHLPDACPFSLDQLLNTDPDELETILAAASQA